MSVNVMSWVWSHSRSRKLDRLVLLAIADCASKDGSNAWPSIAELIEKTGMSERAIHGAIQRLVDDGELVREFRAARRQRNSYRVVMDTAESAVLRTANPAPSTPQDVRPAEAAVPQTVRGDTANPAPSTPQTLRDDPANPAVSIEEVRPLPSDIPSGSVSSELALPADIVDAEVVEPQQPTAKDLIAEWIDHRGADDKPTGNVKGQISKRIKALLEEGVSYDRVRRGLQLWDEKRMHPSTLDSFVDQASAPARTGAGPATSDQRAAGVRTLGDALRAKGL
ncbi:helix-turn-helix protein [Haloactinopolyspora alba]|uniref:Helix-turn-helix protein n=1 Tax=Haloactinopolyspora alba TaxID=648780 RepID=A0A2P8E072_9ACTN|nr:helix-turn-helix domain-containing protein [Haloactinopolyspora alba]PSL02871.1 helix-turn-helix protein [Haloactinopolyspora alba]